MQSFWSSRSGTASPKHAKFRTYLRLQAQVVAQVQGEAHWQVGPQLQACLALVGPQQQDLGALVVF